ncbi:MAG: sigma-54-dependent Fis family transcriptional regulator [Bacteroidales bacterium]|nr:sigma-54-dependent Fis family transcriptional regulator [Bacteroidales bacterium]
MSNKTKGNILIADDNKAALSALDMLLRFEFEKVATVANPNLIPEMLRKSDVDIVLLDMNFTSGASTGNEGLFWLKEIKKHSPTTEVIMITAFGDVELAVKAVKSGAADFALKPWENEKLLATLHATLKYRRTNLEVKKLKSREKDMKMELGNQHPVLIGTSCSMQRVYRLVDKVAATEANVLVTGENGTGKELIAREIHKKSMCSGELMVNVDMGSIPESLFESELFGHKKGSFTDAREDRMGKFQLANKGTLFLDEIGNLPYPLQSKLLVALQNRCVVPVGSNQYVPVDIRLICATNGNLADEVTKGNFREDLLYRINTIHIHLPPLRERDEDIEELAAHFIQHYAKKYQKPGIKINGAAIKKLNRYHWPGNVRELQHTIEKAIILAEDKLLAPEDFVLYNKHEGPKYNRQTLDEMEKAMIEKAIEANDGNITAVAVQLGITRQTLYNKLKKHDL